MRICFFGDSFVNGVGDDTALGWPGRVVAILRLHGLDVTGYNLGVRRETSADILKRWQFEAASRLPAAFPRRLAFSFGTNDCTDGGNGSPRVPQAHALANASAILGKAARIAPTLMIGPVPVLDDPVVDRRIEALSAALAGVCTGVGAAYLDIFSFINGCAEWRAEAEAGDGSHPNKGGYGALAAHIVNWPGFRQWVGSEG